MALDSTLLDQIQSLVEPLSSEERRALIQAIAAMPAADAPAPSAADEARERLRAEQAWWFAQPPSAREPFQGEYVAVRGNTVVDHDADRRALYLRVRERFASEPVLIVQADQSEPRTFTVHSFRLERD